MRSWYAPSVSFLLARLIRSGPRLFALMPTPLQAVLVRKETAWGNSRLDDPAKIAGADPCGMRLRQIFGRAHFDEPGGGALELEGFAIAAPEIEVRRLRCGRGDQLHVPVVERVDEVDEALGLVALTRLDDRDVVEHDRVEGARQGEEVGRTE